MTAPARPGSRYEAELLRVECEQDGGGSPFGWFDGSELTPEVPSRGSTGVLAASEPSGGLPEPDAETAQTGAQQRGAGNGTANDPTGDHK